ncbi:hypothetical protein [Geomicrobium sp. JCM 19055]|uniref:hypothetical protein n=1 Tax=Geomicrobium sp. JCM 19055 TaxID=1460649 RepID=UPI00045ED82E|nr:hypothetical protein JCM19055_1593 [Geomicrobium sp. JCM 19055]
MIDELYEKVQDYLNMEEEIDFKEFQAYYKKVTDYLQAEGRTSMKTSYGKAY